MILITVAEMDEWAKVEILLDENEVSKDRFLNLDGTFNEEGFDDQMEEWVTASEDLIWKIASDLKFGSVHYLDAIPIDINKDDWRDLHETTVDVTASELKISDVSLVRSANALINPSYSYIGLREYCDYVKIVMVPPSVFEKLGL
jgi:hypothetical protein